MRVERDHIGLFGKMNSGKSSVLNLLSQQEAAIVDETPGTTADTKTLFQEIHGMGPVAFYDTAGVDEKGGLGEKKRGKAFSDLKECDLILLIIDPSTKDFLWEGKIVETARELDKQLLVLYNIFRDGDEELTCSVEEAIPLLKFHRKMNIVAVDGGFRQPILEFILENYASRNTEMKILPFIQEGEFYILNIPMDVETPPGRYLRPQAMCEEYITRHWAHPVSYRMDLEKARGQDAGVERERFISFLKSFKRKPRGVITDSQALDVIADWVPDGILLTTFSVMMINYASRGRLSKFAEGLKAVENLGRGDKVLIVEACNHSRIGEDIGTVQIPRHIQKHNSKTLIEYNFGREFTENERLSEYGLVIHCGGCMISTQKLLARLRDLSALGVPYTNYGLFLAYMQGKHVLKRILEPWEIGA